MADANAILILVTEYILIHIDIESHLLLVSSLLMDKIKGRDKSFFLFTLHLYSFAEPPSGLGE